MPLTPAHAAAAWPLHRVFPRLPLAPLVVGTVAPDLEYFYRLAPSGGFGHTALGLLVFCLPVGLAVWLIFRTTVRPAVLGLLPPGLARAVGPDDAHPVAAAGAILIGALSHVAWDSFTHAGGWGVRHLPLLAETVSIAGLQLAWFKVLQHGSTVVGLTLVAVWARRWIGGRPAAARRYEPEAGRRAARIVATLLAIGTTSALLNGLRGMSEGVATTLGYAVVGGMASLVVALVAFGILEKA